MNGTPEYVIIFNNDGSIKSFVPKSMVVDQDALRAITTEEKNELLKNEYL